jgi:hypothetical protein
MESQMSKQRWCEVLRALSATQQQVKSRARRLVRGAAVVLVAASCTDPGMAPADPSVLLEEVAAAEAETIAGDAAAIESAVGFCPDGFQLTETKDVGVAPDVNANGFFCLGEKEKFDDIIPDDRLQVNGHGNFFDKGIKGGLQDISFSFHANPIGKEGIEGKGQFEYHDQTNGLTVHGAVDCLITHKNSAFIAAVVTRSNDAGLPEGAFVGWFTTDNGEAGAGEDQITRPMVLKKGKPGECPAFQFLSGITIESGNIQVH